MCPPYNNSVANVRRIARPSVEAARGLTNGSVNTVHYIDKPYCYASRSLVLAQCNQPYLVMQDGGGVVALTEVRTTLDICCLAATDIFICADSCCKACCSAHTVRPVAVLLLGITISTLHACESKVLILHPHLALDPEMHGACGQRCVGL